MNNIKAVLLDINGTCFPISESTKNLFHELEIDPSLIPQLFAETLRDAFAAQVSGTFVPFKDFAGYHLKRYLAKSQTASNTATTLTEIELAERLASAWESATPWPDVGPGLHQIQHQGIVVAALTNGTVNIAASVLKNAGVESNHVYDINEAYAWKPHLDAYQYAANAMLLSPSEILMVASHPWDCHGAKRAQMKSCYVQRDAESVFPLFLDQPDLVVEDFVQLAKAFEGQ